MDWLRRIWYIATGRRREADLADELAFHREMKTRELREAGVPDDAIAAATGRALGNELLARERARDVWMSPWLQDMSQDLRFGLRMFVKERRFAAAAVLTLGLGLAVNNAVFTIVNATLFRDLPFEQAGRLIAVRSEDARGFPSGVSYPDYLEWQRQTTVFEELCAELTQSVTIGDAAQPAERLSGYYVSAALFRTLRVTPMLGRDFSIDDERDGAAAVTILGYDVWRNRYGGDAGIIGRAVRINEQPTTVIGVMPERFAYPLVTDLWMSMAMVPAARRTAPASAEFTLVGRLKPSASIDQARSEIETVAARIARDRPELKRNQKLSVMSLKSSYFGTGAGALLLTLLGAALIVLLVACANVANLLLARSWHRAREIAIRQALGATRWRVVRQLLIECGLIAGGGAVLGAWLSLFGIDAISSAFNVIEVTAPDRPRRPFWFDPTMDGVGWMFFGLVFLIASLGAGLIPALQLSRTPTNDTLKEGGRTGALTPHARRWSGALVIGQLALSLVLLSGGALLTRAFLDLYYTDPVIDTRDVVQMRITLPPQRYATTAQRQQFLRQLDDRLDATRIFTSSIAIQTLDEAVAISRMGARTAGGWFQTLAFIAVVLALVGLYALTAHGVAQRIHEIGVRMTLGARTRQVMWPFVKRTAVQLALGFTLGMSGALFIGRLMAAFLGDTNPRDPLTLTIVVVAFGTVALSATVWPALRVARVNPVIVLRAD